jgi:thiamine-phosphate pyrophosphorylase
MIDLPRLYPILDTDTLARRGCPAIEAAEGLLEAGVRILQFRHKGHYSRSLLAEAEQVARMCATAGALFVVNDRADIALVLGAALHVGQDDLSPRDARLVLGAGAVVGLSTHNEQQLRAALDEPVDYVAIGPIYSTGSKANPDPVVGVDTLARLRPLVDRPLVAIGGVNLQRARQVYAAGADSIAVIGDLFPAGCGKREIRERCEAWLGLAEL